MSVMEKARDLGEEIRNTEQYQELERVSGNMQDDTEASQMIEQIQELQQQIQFAQQSGVQPSEDQIQQFNDLKGKMDSNLTIQAYARAQNDFSQFMQEVNSAISEGINPEADKEA
ncbi:MAG: YlbF family regulator [Bacillota bacterium]